MWDSVDTVLSLTRHSNEGVRGEAEIYLHKFITSNFFLSKESNTIVIDKWSSQSGKNSGQFLIHSYICDRDMPPQAFSRFRRAV